MSDGFGHNFDAERTLASQMRAHGDEVAGHGARLSANTQGRVGTGPLGEVAETAVKRIVGAFVDGFSAALKDFLHGTADVAEQNVKNMERLEAETAARHDSIGNHHDEPHVGPLSGPGSGSRVGPTTAGRVDENLAGALGNPDVGPLVEDYKAYGDSTPDEFNQKYWDEGTGRWKYPPGGGAEPGTEHQVTLQPGSILDRYGEPDGKYLSPYGIPLSKRSLPPTNLGSVENGSGYHVYHVVEPVPASASTVAPWFEQPGGGIQYKLGTSLGSLVKSGHVKVVPL